MKRTSRQNSQGSPRKRKLDSTPSPSKRQRKTETDQENKGTEASKGAQDTKQQFGDKPKSKAGEVAPKRKDEIKKAQEQEEKHIKSNNIFSRGAKLSLTGRHAS